MIFAKQKTDKLIRMENTIIEIITAQGEFAEEGQSIEITVCGKNWKGHPKIISILFKNFIRSKMDYGSTIYANAPKTT
jgi:hypothetical protein